MKEQSSFISVLFAVILGLLVYGTIIIPIIRRGGTAVVKVENNLDEDVWGDLP